MRVILEFQFCKRNLLEIPHGPKKYVKQFSSTPSASGHIDHKVKSFKSKNHGADSRIGSKTSKAVEEDATASSIPEHTTLYIYDL